MHDTEKIFSDNGGVFHTPFSLFQEKLKGIRGFVFDWDGVFTDGQKLQGGQSSFSEVDSMGLNLLRFGWYLETGEVPCFFIITGLHNNTAIEFARRERFNGVFMNFKDKKLALDYILDNYPVQAHQLAFFYDDVLDLSLCSEVGLRFLMARKSNPMFNAYVHRHQLADYSTACSGGEHVLRECSELCLATLGVFDEAIHHRINFTDTYRQYWDIRQRTHPSFFTCEHDAVRAIDSGQ